MKSRTYLQRLGDRWYVRVKIPRALQGKLRNTHIRRSLGTGDLGEANRRKWPVVAAIQRELERLREDRAATGQGGQGFAALELPSPRQVDLDATIPGVALPSRLVQREPREVRSLDRLVEQWLEQADYLNQTKRQHRHAYLEFRAFLGGDQSPERISPAVALEYVEDVIKSSSQSVATKRRKVNSLMALWEWLATRRITPASSNPWKGFRFGDKKSRGGGNQKKRPYEDHELELIFSSRPNYPRLWEVMVLGLYTGMRLEEICGLHIGDVTFDSQGTAWVKIRRAKTKAGVRTIAVCHDLPVGLLKGLLASSGVGQLFPEFSGGGYDGKLSWAVSKAFGRFRSKLGLNGQTDFHSFRRTFITMLENRQVDQVRIARYVGHELPTLAFAVYSGGSSRQTMVETARAVAFDQGVERQVLGVIGEGAYLQANS